MGGKKKKKKKKKKKTPPPPPPRIQNAAARTAGGVAAKRAVLEQHAAQAGLPRVDRLEHGQRREEGAQIGVVLAIEPVPGVPP